MNRRVFQWVMLSSALVVCGGAPALHAAIPGLQGTTFSLTARTGYIETPEANSYLMWGYANGSNDMQYPGPTLIVNEGDVITVTLTNHLTVAGGGPAPNVSIVFPGQTGVTATGGSQGLLTQEAPPDGTTTVTYTFTASQPGTYMYHSGTSPELQIEMGLLGALIVRPTGYDPMNHMTWTAYGHMDSMYDHEVLFLETEMDPDFHEMIEQGRIAEVDLTTWYPVVWFFNGRCAPDTMHEAHLPWLPRQPYNCMPMIHPGDRLLMRVISGGRDTHPFHTHGNNFTIIARDGRLLQSAPSAGADLSVSDFTISVPPGGTADAIFTWTGEKLGWDMYGHSPDDPLEPGEYEPDHGKPFPVTLPNQQELTFGGMWSGSPFLGALGALPPGEGGLNPDGGYSYMWHSHAEKEMVNYDIFPGGMMTMLMIVPPSVMIMDH